MNETSRIREIVTPTTERRRHSRQPANQDVLVYWQDKSGLPYEARAVLKNLSARGFAIELAEKFPVGGAITVRTSQGSLQCTIRHVQQLPNSFLAGLEVVATSVDGPWERSLDRLRSALASATAK